MTTLKQADPRGLLIDQTTFICSCSPFSPTVCRVCGAETKHTTTQSWTRMNTSTQAVVWPFCPFVHFLKKGGEISTWKHDNFVWQMHLTFCTCSTNATGCHLYNAGWGQTSKNNKDSPSESSETLMCTKLLLDTLSVSYNEMIVVPNCFSRCVLIPQLFAAVAAELMVYQSGKHEKDSEDLWFSPPCFKAPDQAGIPHHQNWTSGPQSETGAAGRSTRAAVRKQARHEPEPWPLKPQRAVERTPFLARLGAHVCLMSRRRGCIRSSCCPQSSCVRHLASRIARYKISITSDVSSNGLRAVCSHRSHRSVSRFPPSAFFSTVFPSFRLPVRLGQSKKFCFFRCPAQCGGWLSLNGNCIRLSFPLPVL